MSEVETLPLPVQDPSIPLDDPGQAEPQEAKAEALVEGATVESNETDPKQINHSKAGNELTENGQVQDHDMKDSKGADNEGVDNREANDQGVESNELDPDRPERKSIPEGAMALEEGSLTPEARAKDTNTLAFNGVEPGIANAMNGSSDDVSRPPRPPPPQMARSMTLPYSSGGFVQKPTESVFRKVQKSVQNKLGSLRRQRTKPPTKIFGNADKHSYRGATLPARTMETQKREDLMASIGADLQGMMDSPSDGDPIYVNAVVSTPHGNPFDEMNEEVIEEVRNPRAGSRIMSESSSDMPPTPDLGRSLTVSTPVMSPLDYQTFHSNDSLHQTGGKRRGKDGGDKGTGNKYGHTMKPGDFSVHYQEQTRKPKFASLGRASTLKPPKPKITAEWYKQSQSIEFPFKKRKKANQSQTMRPLTYTGTGMSVKPPVPRPPVNFSFLSRASMRREPMSMSQPEVSATLRHHQFAEPPIMPQTLTLQRSGPQQPHISPSPRQLTSLQSQELLDKVHRTNVIITDSLQRLVNSSGLGSNSAMTVDLLPYISEDFSMDSYQIRLAKLCSKIESLSVDALDNQKTIDEALLRIHEFLPSLMTDPGSGQVDSKLIYDENIAGLREYLQSCVKLRSAEMQGHYAAFHRPLGSFNRLDWRKRAILRDWNAMAVLGEPNSSVEYLELKGPMVDKMFYSTQSVNNMLIAWLNCKKTLPPTGFAPNVNLTTTLLYHPVLLAVGFDRFQNFKSSDQPGLVLWALCLRLAVLLTCQHFVESEIDQSLDVETSKILIGLSPCNALVAFHYKLDQADAGGRMQVDSTREQNEEQNDHHTANYGLEKFAAELCPGASTVGEAIDMTIDAIHDDVDKILHNRNVTSMMLKALTPPDWIMEAVARICLKKVQVEDGTTD